MKIKCSKCGDEEIANDQLRQMISEYDLWRTAPRIREIIMKSFGSVACPKCGGKIELIEGKYETFLDGSKFKKAGKRKIMKLMARRTKKAVKDGEVKKGDIPKLGEKGMVDKFLKKAEKDAKDKTTTKETDTVEQDSGD